MKITNKNVGWWVLGFIFIIWLKSMYSIGIPPDGKSNLIEFFNLTGCVVFGLFGSVILLFKIFNFANKCMEDEIQFEIDIFQPFRWLFKSRPTPEEEDKKNK